MEKLLLSVNLRINSSSSSGFIVFAQTLLLQWKQEYVSGRLASFLINSTSDFEVRQSRIIRSSSLGEISRFVHSSSFWVLRACKDFVLGAFSWARYNWAEKRQFPRIDAKTLLWFSLSSEIGKLKNSSALTKFFLVASSKRISLAFRFASTNRALMEIEIFFFSFFFGSFSDWLSSQAACKALNELKALDCTRCWLTLVFWYSPTDTVGSKFLTQSNILWAGTPCAFKASSTTPLRFALREGQPKKFEKD